jgi:hypothetical protein
VEKVTVFGTEQEKRWFLHIYIHGIGIGMTASERNPERDADQKIQEPQSSRRFMAKGRVKGGLLLPPRVPLLSISGFLSDTQQTHPKKTMPSTETETTPPLTQKVKAYVN